MKKQGISLDRQVVYPLYYEGELASAYVADVVVEGKLIVELKSVERLSPVHEAQLINYLRLSKISCGYLMNFRNTRLEWKRRVLGA